MRLLLSPLALGLLVLALGPRPSASPDPCDVAGTYALDRAPIVASVVASMDASLADLGPRPPSGTLAATRWTAEKDAYEDVRAEARDGGIVPHMTLALSEDGRAVHRTADAEGAERTEHTGRWQADAACRVVTLDMGDEAPSTARIERGRLVFDDHDTRHRGPFNGVAFDRVR